MINLHHGECLAIMDKLIAEGIKVDAIITDPPYGTTACKWDSVIPFPEMWERLNKLIKTNGAIVLFGSEPFSSALRMSNVKNYKYDWVWNKSKASNFAQAKNAPLKNYENICIFSLGVVGHKVQTKKRMEYNPVGINETPKIYKARSKRRESDRIGHNFSRESDTIDRVQDATGYPKSILLFGSVHNPEYHPTQKPVALMEYLIKTYTNEGETVLDFTMGSGSTGVACVNTNRNFIGIEMDETYFNIARERCQTN